MKKNKDFKPMLAHVYQNQPIDWNQPVYMQPKLDGVRCIFTSNGAFSRTGKRFMNVKHIESALQEMFKQNPWLILDGELYNHDLRDDFEKIISLVRKQKPTRQDRSEARKMIQFHCYDYVFSSNGIVDKIESGMNRYSDRMHQLNCSDMYGDYIKYVPSMIIKSSSEAKDKHKAFLNKGYEGSIIRLDGPYEQKRSKNLLKVKDFHDSEATIVDWVEGKGKREGTIGKFIAQDEDGNQFGMPVMDNFKKLRKDFKLMQNWVGLVATFTYFERTKRNSYRHPLFKALRNYE